MTRTRETGSALLSTLLIMMLASAMLVAFLAVVMGDQRTGASNRDQTTAYAGAHAGLEQLTADLGELFATTFRPTAAQVNGLVATMPDMDGAVSFRTPGGEDGSGYQISFDDVNNDGFPDTLVLPEPIPSGPYQGLRGTVTPYTIEVTARTGRGGEVRMRREMQTVLIPAFQFGIFSENDLSFFAGPSFDFGGRVHTNSNLFLAQGNNEVLSLRDRITAVGEVVRTNLSNGWLTSSNYTGTVRIAKSAGTTAALTDANSVAMSTSQGSWLAAAPQLPPAPEPGVIPAPGTVEGWMNFSATAANGNIMNARTGAKPLVLPLVQMGAQPIDLIRRPVVNSAEDTTNSAVFGQRYYTRASLRILLSDTAADLTGLPGIDTLVAPVDLSARVDVATAPPQPSGWFKNSLSKYVNFAEPGTASPLQPNPGTPVAGQYYAPSGSWTPPGTKLVNGFIKIEMQRPNGVWVDVTTDILNLGYTGARLSRLNPACVGGAGCPTSFKAPLVHSSTAYYLNDRTFGAVPVSGSGAPTCAAPSPNAVIRLQRVRDDHNPGNPCGINAVSGTFNTFDVVPNVLFDPREGNLRDNENTTDTATAPVYLGGLMHYIEVDMRNLSTWLAARAASVDPPESSDGGYVVYISDRRAAARVGGIETGEYGFEDFVNPAAIGTLPNGTLDQGEDMNGIDRDADGSNLDTYGQVPIIPAALNTNATSNGVTVDAGLRPWHKVTAREARQNLPLFFRRAVKFVNGAGTAANSAVSPLTVLPQSTGLTLVVENPVYVQGNYNVGVAATAFGTLQTDHRPSAVIADAVTLVSNLWSDIRSFPYRLDTGADGDCNTGTTGVQLCNGSGRPARRLGDTTYFRLAIVSGKGLSFSHPSWSDQDFGTDGGAHNFLRFIEDWNGTLNYRGSILSFYTSRQATGTYKCCTNVYSPPARGYKFDTEFLELSLLPPKAPAFRDVNTLTFRQVLRATQ